MRWSTKYQTFPLLEGLPEDLYQILEGYESSIVIIDDLMAQCSQNQNVCDLFTKGSHHSGITVMYLTQILFPTEKQSRTISLTYHYMIIFKNPRDSLGITILTRQMYPRNVNYLPKSFHNAAREPHQKITNLIFTK